MIASLFRVLLQGCLAILLSALLLAQASAQSPIGVDAVVDPAQGQQPATPAQQQAKTEEPYPDLLDGTLSALGDIEEDYSPHTSRFRTALENYFD